MSVTAMKPKADSSEDGSKKPGKKKLVLILALVLALGGGGYWFVLRPTPETAPKPGKVVALEAIQVNLAGNHYLRVGIALQLTETAHDVDGSKALDATIEQFSGLPVTETTDPKRRAHHKQVLTKELTKRYHDEVLEVYFTEFVTQ